MKIVLVDLDTSHPEVWLPILRCNGCDVIGVHDSGTIHQVGYADEFAQKNDIPKVYHSLDEMAADTDAAIIHSCDWDTHVAKARVFIEAGKAVLIDKPIAGSVKDLNQFRKWIADGARISGGSSLRFCRELMDWLSKDPSQRGDPHTAYSACAVDDYNYGIHAYSFLCGLMGGGIKSVKHLGKHVQRRIQINWHDGRMGFVVIGQADGWQPFLLSISTEKNCESIVPQTTTLYDSFIELMIPFLAGKAEQPPIDFDVLIEAELAALAARKSWLEDDREVTLAELNEDDAGYDGAAFAAEYKEQKYPSS